MGPSCPPSAASPARPPAPSPPPARRLREGAPRPAGSYRPARTLTETREPPSCPVDALAAVSLGSTERQQPLAVTGAKRRQQQRGPGVAGGAVAALALRALSLAGHQSHPPPPRAQQQEGIRLDGGEARRMGVIHSFITRIRGFFEELTGESSKVREGWSAREATRWKSSRKCTENDEQNALGSQGSRWLAEGHQPGEAIMFHERLSEVFTRERAFQQWEWQSHGEPSQVQSSVQVLIGQGRVEVRKVLQ